MLNPYSPKRKLGSGTLLHKITKTTLRKKGFIISWVIYWAHICTKSNPSGSRAKYNRKLINNPRENAKGNVPRNGYSGDKKSNLEGAQVVTEEQTLRGEEGGRQLMHYQHRQRKPRSTTTLKRMSGEARSLAFVPRVMHGGLGTSALLSKEISKCQMKKGLSVNQNFSCIC